MYIQVLELVLMGRMGTLQPDSWWRKQGRKPACLYLNPVIHTQIRELVLMGRMGALQPELWRQHQG